MRQRESNREIKKNFILYKGHTGWKVKTRIFGSLVVTFSALALAEGTGVIDVHAATAADSSLVSPKSDSQPSVESAPAATKPAAPTSQLAVNSGTSDKSGQLSNEDSASNTDKAAQLTSGSQQQKPVAESASLTADDAVTTQDSPEVENNANSSTDSKNATQYPVLKTNGSVNVGVDKTQVSLVASQIADNFTATIENRDGGDKDYDTNDNTHTAKINSDGSIALTSNDSHKVYSSPSSSKNVTGHQAAHVSFGHEIDFSHNFSMSGALGIGTKSDGADSVGFIFAPGNPAEATKGGSGGQLGLQGLKNAFGFVYDQYNNTGSNAAGNQFNDPEKYRWEPYVGWRTTDANGKLQTAADSDWSAASDAGLNDRDSNPMNDFTMNYDANNQELTVVLGKATLTRRISDVSSGYSISVAASTGGAWNDYSARIDKFSYTPKTIPLAINVVDSAEKDALLDKTEATAVANIGDTISVFSTQTAAQRAVDLGEVDPNLVSVLPTDSADNVYVIDANHPSGNGTVHYIGGDQNKSLADATYYSYTVSDGDNQQMTVPVRLAFKAVVTPVDSTTKDPIVGLNPVSVIAVAGEPVLVQIPGYTPTTVILDAPTNGQKEAQDKLLINQAAANTDGTTPTSTTSDAIAHYYTATSQTVDGNPVKAVGTIGTGQNIADYLNKQSFNDATGNPVTSGVENEITVDNTDYYWSAVGTAGASDSTDANQPQVAGSILVPTTKTLQYWVSQATTNQTKAEAYKASAQEMFNEFNKIEGLTSEQKDAAKSSLDTITKIYTSVSDSNTLAKTAFENGEAATDAQDIYNDGQIGYASLKTARNLLVQFKTDLDQLTTTNTDAQDSLVTLSPLNTMYGDPIGFPKAAFGVGFGTLSDTQKAGLNKAGYFQYSDQAGNPLATPKDAGTYLISLTDDARSYLKTLKQDNPNIGLFVSSTLTIKAKPVTPTIAEVTISYGDMPALSGSLGETDDAIYSTDFEIFDKDAEQVVLPSALRAKGNYEIRYTDDAQKRLKQDKNYQFGLFGTANLTVIPREITVKAQKSGKGYGSVDPELDLTSESKSVLVNDDKITDLGVVLKRDGGENVGSYTITLDTNNSAINPNYKVNVDPGVFIIKQLPVTVTIANAEKYYGDSDPAEQLTSDAMNQLVKGDTLTDLGQISYTRDSGENVGDGYQIRGTADNSKGNYFVTVNPGIFAIKQRPVTVKIEGQSKTYV